MIIINTLYLYYYFLRLKYLSKILDDEKNLKKS